MMSDPGAVVDRRELVVLLPGALHRSHELDVDLHPVPGLRLLVPLPAVDVAAVALRGRQPVHLQALEDPPHAGVAHSKVVVALEIHRNLRPTSFARSSTG
jgi:hypothetical protein